MKKTKISMVVLTMVVLFFIAQEKIKIIEVYIEKKKEE